MLRLDGYFNADTAAFIYRYTNLRFRDPKQFTTPEALVLYEQRYLKDDVIKRLCEEAVGTKLYEPQASYVPQSIIERFAQSGLVPVVHEPMDNKVTCVYLPGELELHPVSIPGYLVEQLPTTLHYYLTRYQRCFGLHPVLQQIPAKQLFDMIVSEAVGLQASDITISSGDGTIASIYYNVRKRKVMSNRVVLAGEITDIIKCLCIRSAYDFTSRVPKYVDVDLSREYRGRVVINRIKTGYAITIRLLPNSAFSWSLRDLNLSEKAIEWVEGQMFDKQSGLRLIVGATMSGKNTTALAGLNGLMHREFSKVVSVEMPVEQILPGIEQISVEDEKEYRDNVKSLIHQNPDFVYITEIRDSTGLPTIEISNTGKRVLSTLHANGVADTVTRLTDITQLSTDRIFQTLHSVCYQELVRDEDRDRIFPRIRFLRFTDELKDRLYGKPLGEIIRVIRSEEGGDIWNRA